MNKIKRLICACLFTLQTMSPSPHPLAADSVIIKHSKLTTSQEGIQRLIEGNQRFADDKINCEERHSLRRSALLATQNPFAIILGCADSRIPIEIVFDQGVGDLFVVRVAGNVAGTSEVESIEYGVKHLNSVVILVLGHEDCAAVTSVLNHDAADIPEIAALIESSLKVSHDKKISVEQAVKANIRLVVEMLKSSKILKPLLEERNIEVVGGYYNLKSGLVEFLQ